jgi:formyltetrahydrofolate deformylase
MAGTASASDSSSTPTTATLLVACPDRPGLVAALSQLLYGHGVNILDADQHTDTLARKFFQRIHFDLAAPTQPGARVVEPTLLESSIAEVAARFEMDWSLRYDARIKRVAIFVSKTDHCLWDLLLRHRAGEYRCELALIVSNHGDLEPVARQFDVPFRVVPVTPQSKARQEAAQIALLEAERIDLVVLARYMQILSDGFVARYPARIINIHHSFLPAFSGGRPYHQAYARGVKRVGATAHYATAELDEGPIIEQDVIRVSHRDSPADLVRKGRDVERAVLSRAIRLHLEDRVLVYDNKTVVFD